MSNLTLKAVRKSYGNLEVLKGIDLAIKSKEFVVFVGPSGCGKSTLLRMIAGLEHITSGDLEIGDTRMNDVDPSKRGIAMVFQSYALYPHMTVRENMGFALRFAGVAKDQIAKQVQEAARILALEPLLDRVPKELSGGQRQRVGIARALALSPKFVLADEIVSGLDVSTQAQILTLLEKLAAEMGLTVAFISHDLSVIRRLCRHVIVMRQGMIVEASATDALFEHPQQDYTRDLISAIPLPEIDAGWLNA